jgi:hypothetical protein
VTRPQRRTPVAAIVVFSLGLAMTVAPLTATVLAVADETDAGIASVVMTTASSEMPTSPARHSPPPAA